MGTEIEHKFLVANDGWRGLVEGKRLTQGYLCRDTDRSVRVRIKGEQAWLTIKGRSEGAKRAEFEYAVPVEDAQAMLGLCTGVVIDKTRYAIPMGPHTWEVDEFHGRNAGLLVAEIELGAEGEAFERPAWLGAEVTHETRYFNANLADRPYDVWTDAERG